MAAAALAWNAAALIDKIRARRPRIHCITNGVAQGFTANALLAIGAVPSMTTSPEEIGAFVGGADALLVNLGTLDEGRRQVIRLAIGAAKAKALPWVLDPVFIERSPSRALFAREIAAAGPTVIRGNEAEIAALSQGRPVDAFALGLKTVVAATGATDHVMDGARVAGTPNGHPLMAKVTAMGCAGAAIIAAFLAVAEDPFEACACGLVAVGVAGEIAAEQAAGPGSFAVAYLDALHGLESGKLATRARVV
ncbi:hydroxyethylthiazole kinase [Phreatobacter stygius]|uniref:Hydroxyethylthiazole kinase n=1 Tax=Phreatobacter stygius TaxID=1940610 RepID=A0A4D7API9_9HYPH|nr:hydroxyethylthiazole kinase [Phreatobacter stygius]QCI63104.1 hydroxyethylthiazole kinase [Phreatobacter stygius]